MGHVQDEPDALQRIQLTLTLTIVKYTIWATKTMELIKVLHTTNIMPNTVFVIPQEH